MRHVDIPAGIGAGEQPDGRWRQRLLWLFLGLVALMIGAAAMMVVRMLQADRALRHVEQAAVIPAAAPGITPAGSAMNVPLPLPDEGARPMTLAANGAVPPATAAAMDKADKADSAGMTLPSPAPHTTVAAAAGAVATQAAPPASPVAPVSSVPARPAAPADTRGAAGDGTKAAAKAAEAGRKARMARREAARRDDGDARRRTRDARAEKEAMRARKAAARAPDRNETSRRASSRRDGAIERAARGDDAFRRCPPLGRKGAVTCRLHVCNGGAGKERACRPYLERRP